MHEYKLQDSNATEAFGFALAAHLRMGDIVALSGLLAAGKTDRKSVV